jgi:hypothetical protein
MRENIRKNLNDWGFLRFLFLPSAEKYPPKEHT